MTLREDEEIPGSDIKLGIYQEQDAPTLFPQDPDNPWLPATDWSRDGIIGKQTP